MTTLCAAQRPLVIIGKGQCLIFNILHCFLSQFSFTLWRVFFSPTRRLLPFHFPLLCVSTIRRSGLCAGRKGGAATGHHSLSPIPPNSNGKRGGSRRPSSLCLCRKIKASVTCLCWLKAFRDSRTLLLPDVPRALKEADVVVLLGARLNWILHFGLAPRFHPKVKIIQVCLSVSDVRTRPTCVCLHPALCIFLRCRLTFPRRK